VLNDKNEFLGVDLKALGSLAEDFASKISRPCVVLMTGGLGVGKTQFVKLLANALGGSESFSPTYSLINEVPILEGKLYHVDLYRSKGEEDIESTGFWELFSDEKGLVCIEWPDLINKSELPEHWNKIEVHMTQVKEDALLRNVSIEWKILNPKNL